VRAVVYCRVSSADQVENYSLGTQEAGCRTHCERQGWEVDRVFVERGESAKTADRTEFQAMLSYCRKSKGRVQFVVVYNLSRFARNQYDHHAVRALLHSLGITLRSVTEPVDDGISGQLMEGILAAFHEFDNAKRREAAITGMRAAVKDGRWCWHPPFGYVNNGGELAPDPGRAHLITEAFRLLAEGHSVSETRRLVAAKGMRLTRSDFFKLVKRPIYAGWIDVPSWGLRTAGQHPALVDQQTWDRAQLALRGKGGKLYLLDNPDFPLRRFVACGICEKTYTGGWSKGRAGKRYGYYRCVNTKCGATSVAKAALEERFAHLLSAVTPSPRYLAALRLVVLDALNQQQGEAKAQLQAARREVDGLEKRRERLVEAYIFDQAVSREVYEGQLDKLNLELSLARCRLGEAQIEDVDAEGILGFAEHVAVNAERLWVEFDAEQKRRFQRFAFPGGVRFAAGAFLNPQPSPLFGGLRAVEVAEAGNGRPEWTGFEPLSFVHHLGKLRAQLGFAGVAA
jgi:site-specific DNA recombinase